MGNIWTVFAETADRGTDTLRGRTSSQTDEDAIATTISIIVPFMWP